MIVGHSEMGEAPWHPYIGEEDADEDIPEGVDEDVREGKNESEAGKSNGGDKIEYVYVEVGDQVPRDL